MKMVYAREAAEILGVHVDTVLRWLRDGKIKGARKVKSPHPAGFIWRIPVKALSDLEAKPIGRRAEHYGHGRNGKNR